MADQETSFIVGEAFPTATKSEENQSASLVRFLLAVRPLYFLQRAITWVPKDTPTIGDDYNIALSITLGALKEAADAFRHALTQSHIDEFIRPKALQGMSEDEVEKFLGAYEYLKKECGAQRGTLLATIVGPMRNDAGFHWDFERIKGVLKNLSYERYAFRSGGPTRQESSFPFLADFVDQLRGSIMQDESDLNETSKQLIRMWEALVVMADHIFLVRACKSAS